MTASVFFMFYNIFKKPILDHQNHVFRNKVITGKEMGFSNQFRITGNTKKHDFIKKPFSAMVSTFPVKTPIRFAMAASVFT